MSSCYQSEFDSIAPDNNVPEGDPVEISISLGDSPEYSASDMNSSDNPSTRGDALLIGEWVKPEHFSVTRSAEDYEGPAIAALELFETPDSADVSGANTRATMASGVYFRVIAFKKSGSSYVFQSVADYTSNGASAPILKQGKMAVSMGATCRFVAYSFNNSSAMGTLPSTYTWNSSSISIPNLSNDFMTYDSGDKVISGASLSLGISFKHQLCKLTIKPSVTGFSTNNYSCSNAYISQGGNSSSWTIGSTGIVANTNNTATFSIANTTTGSTTIRIIPFAAAKTISAYFGTLSVGGNNGNGTTVTSSQSVKLLAGKSYTMTVKFKKLIGIKVPQGSINLGGASCTSSDKQLLSKLAWADGNLCTGGLSDLEWETDNSYAGYYYTWYSIYRYDGYLKVDYIDPCTRVNTAKYGSGWKTPNAEMLGALGRCTDKVLVNARMFFMNKTIGVSLPAGGRLGYKEGSGTQPNADKNKGGYYWTIDTKPDDTSPTLRAYSLVFAHGSSSISYGSATSGYNVRCVKE